MLEVAFESSLISDEVSGVQKNRPPAFVSVYSRQRLDNLDAVASRLQGIEVKPLVGPPKLAKKPQKFLERNLLVCARLPPRRK